MDWVGLDWVSLGLVGLGEWIGGYIIVVYILIYLQISAYRPQRVSVLDGPY